MERDVPYRRFLFSEHSRAAALTSLRNVANIYGPFPKAGGRNVPLL